MTAPLKTWPFATVQSLMILLPCGPYGSPRRRSPQNAKKGQGLVEFALVFPIVVALIVVVLELGIVFYAYVTVVYATREGARVGALYQTVAAPLCSDPSIPNQAACRQAANDQNRETLVRTTVTNSLGFLKSAPPNLVQNEIVVTYPPMPVMLESRAGQTVEVNVTYHYGFLTGMFGSTSGINLRGNASARIE